MLKPEPWAWRAQGGPGAEPVLKQLTVNGEGGDRAQITVDLERNRECQAEIHGARELERSN